MTRVTAEPITTTLNRGVNTIPATRDTSMEIVRIAGKTTINYVPLFDSGAWTLHPNVVILSSTKLSLKGTASNQNSTIRIYTNPNTLYTFSYSGDVKLSISEHGSNNSLLTAIKTSSNNVKTITFTSKPTSLYIVITLSNLTDITNTLIFENIMLNEGSTVQEFVANVKGVTNPTVEVKGSNLADHSVWEDTLPKNNDGFFIEHYANSKRRELPLILEKGKTYSISVTGYSGDVDTYSEVVVVYRNTSNTVIGYEFALSFEGIVNPTRLSKSFTARNDMHSATLSVSGDEGYLYFKEMMLNEGSAALPYEPYRSRSLTVQGTFYAGDLVDVINKTVTRTAREVLLDDKLTYVFNASIAGAKRVFIEQSAFPSSHKPISVSSVVKFNGSILTAGNFENDTFVGEAGYGRLYMTIPSADSGWGDNYTPTANEIKAYFMGWSMKTTSGTLYNGEGEVFKRWQTVGNSSNWSPLADNGFTRSTLPKEMSPYGYKPYRVTYNLDNVMTEPIEVIGSLRLVKGNNRVELTEGRIVREKATPVFYPVTREYYINNGYLPSNPLTNYSVSQWVGLYANGMKLGIYPYTTNGNSDWMYYYNLGAGYDLRINKESFDPSVTYEVDYIPMEAYKVSSYVQSITCSYQTEPHSTTNKTIEEIVELQRLITEQENILLTTNIL